MSPYLQSQPWLPGAWSVPQFGLLAMRFLLPLSLLVLLAAAYQGGGSARRRRAVWTQGSEDNSPAPSDTEAPFRVRINPSFKAVPPGSSVWLNCSSSCPLPENSSLHTGLQRGQTLRGSNWVSFQLLDVRAWSSDVHCFVTCAGVTLGAMARIHAYSEGKGLRPGWDEGRGTEMGQLTVALGGARGLCSAAPSWFRTATQRDPGASGLRGQ